jgi:hypothetical protein
VKGPHRLSTPLERQTADGYFTGASRVTMKVICPLVGPVTSRTFHCGLMTKRSARHGARCWSLEVPRPRPQAPRYATRMAVTEPDPVVEAYKREIDRTLLRENLRRTPEERLTQLMHLQAFAEELRRAGRQARRD